MKITVAISLVGLALVAAPAAFAQTLTLDGVLDPSLSALDGGTPVYDYTYSGTNPVVISGQLSGAPGASLDGTSLTPDPTTTGTDVLIGSIPATVDGTGNYPTSGNAVLADITVPNSGLDPNNIGNYAITGSLPTGAPFGAVAGFHIISSVPEPGSIAMLLGLAGSGVAFLRRRR